MKILADDRIPFVSELFSGFGELTLKPSAEIRSNDLRDVNVLLTRTVTPVDSRLLEGTKVRFVGSATAGFDHVDHEWLTQQGIAWAYAPGANAVAVAEYVLCCIAYLRKQNRLPRKNITAGVIGVGHVGSAVVDRLEKIGMTVLQNDPPRVLRDPSFTSVPHDAFRDADLVCVHTPLTKTGEFPTHHLIDEKFLAHLKPGCVLLNAGRGAVVDTDALLQHNEILTCLDVWENEPDIDLALLEKAVVATPHVAGYSQQSKLRATLMIYEQFLKHFKLTDVHRFQELQQVHKTKHVDVRDCRTVDEILLKIYNPASDTNAMKEQLLKDPKNKISIFPDLRRHYVFRDEFSAIPLTGLARALNSEIRLLGFRKSRY